MAWIAAEKKPGKTGKQWCDRCDARVRNCLSLRLRECKYSIPNLFNVHLWVPDPNITVPNSFGISKINLWSLKLKSPQLNFLPCSTAVSTCANISFCSYLSVQEDVGHVRFSFCFCFWLGVRWSSKENECCQIYILNHVSRLLDHVRKIFCSHILLPHCFHLKTHQFRCVFAFRPSVYLNSQVFENGSESAGFQERRVFKWKRVGVDGSMSMSTSMSHDIGSNLHRIIIQYGWASHTRSVWL